MFSSNLARGEASLLQILLVIVLRPIELRGGNDLGGDGPPVTAALFEGLFRGDRGRLLSGTVKKDRGAVLSSDVRSLAVELRRVVLVPKDVEQLLVAHPGRVVFDLNRFRVAGFVRAHVFVSRI